MKSAHLAAHAAAHAAAHTAANIAAIALLALATTMVGCGRREPALFGRACVDDGECDVEDGLVCDPLRHQCAPPRVPAPIPGLTCADAHVLELRDVGGLLAGSIDVELGPDASPTPAGASCAGELGRWVYARVDVPAAMSARIVASGLGKLNIAVMTDACEPQLEHACSTGDDVVVPLLQGTVTIAVSASTGSNVQIAVEQVRCPAGFVPSETGCLGFLDVTGPTPRVDHQLTVVDGDTIVASGGLNADGGHVASELFSRRALRWRDTIDGAVRDGHAAAATDGFFFAVGGGGSGSEILDRGTTRFVRQAQPFEAIDVRGGTLTRISRDVPMLFVGGVEPVITDFFGEPGDDCNSSSDCQATFACVAVFGNSFDEEIEGICLCVAENCNRLLREVPAWFSVTSPPDLFFRQRHVAIDFDDDPEDALVLVTGGVVNDPEGSEIVQPSSFALLGDSQTWVQMPQEPAARRDALGASIGDGDVILVGGRNNDEVPLDLVELWTPLLANPPNATHLARARADAAGALLGAPGAASTFVVIGGDDGNGPLATTELIDVVTGTARVGPTLPFPLSGARAALLTNGELLVVGGRTVDANGDESLVDAALLLIEVPPTLVKPDVGAGLALPEIEGDFCEDAVALVGDSGAIEGNTIGFQDDLDVDDDPGCNGVIASRGFDVFFQLDVPAGASIDLVLVDPIGAADLVLVVYDSCPLDFPCVDGADIEIERRETLTVDVTEATTLFIAVDGFAEDAPYNYRLEWSVTP